MRLKYFLEKCLLFCKNVFYMLTKMEVFNCFLGFFYLLNFKLNICRQFQGDV